MYTSGVSLKCIDPSERSKKAEASLGQVMITQYGCLGQVAKPFCFAHAMGWCLQHACQGIGDWIGFYNHQCPHHALGMKTPADAYALAA